MKFPNKYLRNLKPYKLASHKIWSVTPEERPLILKLDWNEASIPPSPKVRECIQKILDEPCFLFKRSRMEWNDMLKLLKNSKAVLDIPRDGQIGLTTIVIQALGTGTKIITTDEHIKDYPFYDPDMIQVVKMIA